MSDWHELVQERAEHEMTRANKATTERDLKRTTEELKKLRAAVRTLLGSAEPHSYGPGDERSTVPHSALIALRELIERT